ncbi:hypothetical protein E2562_020132 [Oryza meyeriana var. granulata]|uniref:Uncharacterized protein n=1 Tax=Oryza meyeriana var. granulata TaxID=110450 RepID=A0A6G1BLW7_9ORYZ|nr:hypothetical protein E2562_020132 [Oryza meyeriana var. granulata]
MNKKSSWSSAGPVTCYYMVDLGGFFTAGRRCFDSGSDKLNLKDALLSRVPDENWVNFDC